MSEKQKLSKKIAHTLLAMSIVYSGGMNVLCNTAFADPVDGTPGTDGAAIVQNDDISAGVNATYTADNGTPGGDASGGGRGGDGGNGGSVTVNDTITGTIGGAIDITATGGDAGNGGKSGTYANEGPNGDGGDSGDSKVAINVRGGGITTVNNITVTAQAGDGAGSRTLENQNYDASNSGKGGSAAAIGLQSAVSNTLVNITAADVTISAEGGKGGYGGSSYGNGSVGGMGGAAEAYGLKAATNLFDLTMNDINVTAVGGMSGHGGGGGASGNIGNGADAGAAGTGAAWGIAAVNSNISGTVNSISAAATGGAAVAYGLHLTAADNASVTADSLVSTANGGAGGNGGNGGGPGRDNVGDKAGDGGNGGNGGNATAYAAYADGSRLQLTTGSIIAAAIAGSGGAAGEGATKTDSYGGSPLVNATVGVDGTAGTAGTAKAYGIYATGSTVELKHSTPGSTVTIDATATGTDSEAYAVYAADSNIILQDKINITSGTTFLHNSIVAFADRTADRTLTSSGELKLSGSNEFRVTTDLTNDAADKFTFARLADNSSTEKQYITVGYDKAFDGSDLASISGDAVVLTVTDLNNQNLENFAGKTSTLDSPLTRFTATPTVEVNNSDVKITQIDFGRNGEASETVMTASDAQMALGSMWRVEGNNLMKRMGELRSDKEAAKGGVWARYYRGELSADSAYDRNYSQDYTAFQGGIDKVQDYKGGKLYTGIAVNRIDSNAGYTAGSGDLSSTGVGLYASWLGSKGHYVDVIARGSKLANDFKLVDLSGNSAKADYDTYLGLRYQRRIWL